MQRSERVIKFIERYCYVPEGSKLGQLIKLDPFQKKFIRDVYDNPAPGGTSEAILSMARKNGKTAFIACLLICHIAGPEAVQNSQIVSGANTKGQAAILFELAVKIINQSEKLVSLIKVTPHKKELLGLALNVHYQALSADGKNNHGLSPILAILDEVGQVRGPRSDFIDAVITAQGTHENAMTITISTQAASDTDLLSIWIDDAIKSRDPNIVCHVYESDPECDLDDVEQWKKSNPALGTFRSASKLAMAAKKAMRMPSFEATFRNLNLNQRIGRVSPFVSKGVWEKGKDQGVFDFKLPIYCGLDLSQRTDLTAFIITQRQGYDLIVKSLFWTPDKGLKDRAKTDKQPYDIWVDQGLIKTCPGSVIDYEFVVSDILDELSDFENIEGIAFDRWRIDVLKKELVRAGVELPLVEFGQGFKDMSPAIELLEEDLLNENIQHGNNPVLTMCAANAIITKDPAGGRKFDKSKDTGRIDGMVALAMARGIAGRVIKEKDKEPELFFL